MNNYWQFMFSYKKSLILLAFVSFSLSSFSQDIELDIPESKVKSQDSTKTSNNPVVQIGKKLISIPKFLFSSKITTDTNYVARPVQPMTVKFRCDVKNNLISYDYDGSSGYLDNDWAATFGFGLNYKGLSISLGGNPSKWFKWNADKEIGINIYNNRFGIDASYYRLKHLYDYDSFSKWLKDDYTYYYDDALTKGWNVNVYYVFNNKRFSYPAAFSQTWIQKHSAGSFLVSATYNHRDITTNMSFEYEDEEGNVYVTPENFTADIKTHYLALGAGYAYNFVPNRHWLLHISAIPGVMVAREYTQNILDPDGNNIYSVDCRSTIDYVVNVRTSAIYSWNRYFAGVTGIYALDATGNHNEDFISYTRWKLRFVFGLRLDFDPLKKFIKK